MLHQPQPLLLAPVPVARPRQWPPKRARQLGRRTNQWVLVQQQLVLRLLLWLWPEPEQQHRRLLVPQTLLRTVPPLLAPRRRVLSQGSRLLLRPLPLLERLPWMLAERHPRPC